MTAYLGPLNGDRAKLDYVNFYAHLHRVVDAKIGRLLDALGDPGDPGSLRSRTIIFRCADHGEMGLSHGGLRQKAFNAYEETIHIPLVISNPVLFPEPARDRRARLADRPGRRRSPGSRVPSSMDLTADRIRGRDLSPILAERASTEAERLRAAEVDLDRGRRTPSPAPSVQEEIHFTYDDHQAATALQDVPGQPNRIRAVRTAQPQVRDLLRSRRQGAHRVRDVRPRARRRRAPQPDRSGQRGAARGGGRGGFARPSASGSTR